MNRIPISPTTIEGIEAHSVFISVVMYTPGDTSRQIYYGFYDAYGILIPNGEGNLTMPDGFGEYTDNVIESAVDGTDVLLRIVQLYSSEYQIQYNDSGDIVQETVNITILPRVTFNEIALFVFDELSIEAYDAEVLHVMSAAEEMGATTAEIAYLAEFIQGLVDDDSYNDWIQIFAFVGDSVNNKVWNLLNHHDTLSSVGTPQDHADGISLLNSSGSEKLVSEFEPGITGFGGSDGLVSTHPWATVVAHFKSPTAAAIVNGLNLGLITVDTGNISYPYLSGDNATDYTFSISPTLEGSFVWRRNNNTQVNVRNAGSSIHTSTQAEAGFGTGRVSFHIREFNGARGVFSFVAIGKAIDDTKVAAFESRLNTLMTNLNRI